jgi:hypothetical protein
MASLSKAAYSSLSPQAGVHFTVTDPYVFDLKMAPRRGTLDLCGLPW